ncbi:hypothetical protein [Burkholderia cepacia]|nr:hypothetical protein [Burkholderia cepacia]
MTRLLKPRAGKQAIDGPDGVCWCVERAAMRDAQDDPAQPIG